MDASTLLNWLPDALAARHFRPAVRSGHETRFGDKSQYGTPFPPMHTLLKEPAVPTAPTDASSDPAELAKRTIRQQWPLRRHSDAAVRHRARNLIQGHVEMLRVWR